MAVFGGGGSLPLSGYFALRAQYAATPSFFTPWSHLKSHQMQTKRKKCFKFQKNPPQMQKCPLELNVFEACGHTPAPTRRRGRG